MPPTTASSPPASGAGSTTRSRPTGRPRTPTPTCSRTPTSPWSRPARRAPPELREAQEGMTTAPLRGGPEPPARAAVVSVPARATGRAWWRTHTVQRHIFGYTLLAPAALYVLLLVGAPFVFSLWLAV